MENGYKAVIKEFGGTYRKEFKVHSHLSQAERVARGASINLNHDNYYVVVEKIENGEVVEVIEGYWRYV